MKIVEEVFAKHLKNRKAGRLEEDLINYAADVVMLTSDGVFRGYEGVLQCAKLLQERLSNAEPRYRPCLISGEVAFLEWTAPSPQAQVRDDVDIFLIRDGRIKAQTVHYCPPSRRGKLWIKRVRGQAALIPETLRLCGDFRS